MRFDGDGESRRHVLDLEQTVQTSLIRYAYV
jgi:hypothetical protein